MDKLVSIFELDDDNKAIPLRVLQVDASFTGIGKWGNIVFSEFKSLADDLEPHARRKKIIITDL